MSKYKKKREGGQGEKVKSLIVKWDCGGGSGGNWPKKTIVTEGNLEAVLVMVGRGGGRDVFEVVFEEGGEEGVEK